MKENKLWFKAKRYGWGWYPITWQGWLVIAAYVLGLIFIFRSIDIYSHSVSDTFISLALPYLITTSILIFICYKKGEKLGWRWGK